MNKEDLIIGTTLVATKDTNLSKINVKGFIQTRTLLDKEEVEITNVEMVHGSTFYSFDKLKYRISLAYIGRYFEVKQTPIASINQVEE